MQASQQPQSPPAASPQAGLPQSYYPPSSAFYPQFAPSDTTGFALQTSTQPVQSNQQQSMLSSVTSVGPSSVPPEIAAQYWSSQGGYELSVAANPQSVTPVSSFAGMQAFQPIRPDTYDKSPPASPMTGTSWAPAASSQGLQSPQPSGYYPSSPLSPTSVAQGVGMQGFQWQPGCFDGAPAAVPVSPQQYPSFVPQQPMSPGVAPSQPSFDFSKTDELFVPPGGEISPPTFTPYDAKFFTNSHGDIVTHDPHLNEDGELFPCSLCRPVLTAVVCVGEALYRFLLARSQAPPKFQLHLHGEHTEYEKYKVAVTDSHGSTSWHTKTEAHTIIDFDFTIDLTRYIATVPVHFTVGDSEAAFRGKLHKELVAPAAGADVEGGVQLGRRRATYTEGNRAKAWKRERQRKGLPPWIGPGEGWDAMRSPDAITYAPNANVLKSSWTVRKWADEYCASTKLLKEFTYEKVCAYVCLELANVH